MWWSTILTIILCYFALYASSAELTFELPDKARECFHEIISQNQTVNVDFQVVTGGAHDVDVMVQGPEGQMLYEKVKITFDALRFVTEETGEYKFCFSNEFSTFTHKLVYMELRIGEQVPQLGLEPQITVMTQMESSLGEVAQGLTKMRDFQTYHRLRETQGRKSAEDLNERVLRWSLVETLGIIIVSITQVFVVRTLFSEKRPTIQKPRYVIQ